MSERIRDIAAHALDHGWTWEAVGKRGTTQTDAVLNPALDDITASLSEDDRRRFAGHVPIVERDGDTPEQAVARAKLAHLLDIAMESERLGRALERPLAESPAFAGFPELREQFNDDGMLPGRLFRALPDAFEYKAHAFAFSELTPLHLRRRLTKLARQPDAKLLWRAAETTPIPIANYAERLEKAIEYGVGFRDDLILQRLWTKHLPTVLRREAPVNEVEAAYDRLQPLDRLEVLRTERSDRVSFLFEELVPLSERHLDVGFVATRIFHCDSIIGTGTFEHVDASQLIYRVETYEQRLSSAMKDKVKAEGHLKLFWIASCPVAEWKALLFATYPANELVAEYLTGTRSFRPVSRRVEP